MILTPFESRLLQRLKIGGPSTPRKLAAVLWATGTGAPKVVNVVTVLRKLSRRRLVRIERRASEPGRATWGLRPDRRTA